MGADMADLDDPVDPTPAWQAEHVRDYLATDGQKGHEWRPGVYTLLLTTRGRKSGQARRNALIYRRDGDRYVVVASKGGSPEQPAWFHNLSSDPQVRVQVQGERFDATARVADAQEKARLWPMMTEVWPDYDSYQARTARDIPVVILEPVGWPDRGGRAV
jgi:deazaflavin-dependent oxidoreductase (nitroreductase family)